MRTLRALVGLCLLLYSGGCSFEKTEREIGHVGAARRDPFLAAQRFLSSRGFDVGSATRFADVLGDQNTVITPAQSFVSHGMATRVLKWVSRGGHLVLFLRDGEAFRNDWLTFSLKDLEEPDPEMLVLFEELGVDSVDYTKTSAKGEILGRAVEYESPASFKWKDGKKPLLQFVLGDSNQPAAASFGHGDGQVTVIASAKPFRNRYIGDGENAWTFWLLVGHTQTTAIWFLQGVRISFFGMLWDHGWMAIVALLPLIAFWLWRHLPRFGPLRQAPQESHRDFASHLGVIGAFQWRHGQAQRLLAPLRETIMRAAARRGWTSGEPAGLVKHLALAAEIPPQRVQSALEHQPREPQSFLAVVQDLQRIATALRT